MDNQVNRTTNYDQFVFLEANRDQSRGHVEALKRAFDEIGNLTRVQPILVNDNMEIIDGQHRFVACKELGEPIFYTVVPGLGVNDARQMNILHRGWTIEDFARSYAAAGDPNYQKYLELREDYGFNHSILMNYITNSQGSGGEYKEFRVGNFVMPDIQEVRSRLTRLAEAGEFVPMVSDRYFARAFLRAQQVEGYDHKRMLRKLELHQNLLRRYASTEDYLRMLEEIYNHQMQESSRLRLY